MSATSLHKMPSKSWMTAKQWKVSLTQNFQEDSVSCGQAANQIHLYKDIRVTSSTCPVHYLYFDI